MSDLLEARDRIREAFSDFLGSIDTESSTLDYQRTMDLASKSGKKVGELIADELLSLYPSGQVPKEVADQLIPPALRQNYDFVSDISARMQQRLNEQANIGISVVKPEVPTKRIENLADYVASKEDFSGVSGTFTRQTENLSLSTVDDTVRANADLHSGAGLSPKVTRTVRGKCCKWCADLAGKYEYPYGTPADFWRRHRDCRCCIEYFPVNGRSERVRNYNKNDTISAEQREKEEAAEQEYRPVHRGTQKKIHDPKYGDISVRKVDGYDDVWVSDEAVIKPRALHDIVNRNNEAIRAYGLENEPKPSVIIVNGDEMSALGKYDAVNNRVMYIADVGKDKDTIKGLYGDGAVSYHPAAVEYHEMYHFKQATDYRNNVQPITENTYNDYMTKTIHDAKAKLDASGIDGYNVKEYGFYADLSYLRERYDEVDAEVNVRKQLGR